MVSHTAPKMGFTVWTTVWTVSKLLKTKSLAERVGFEPTIPVKVYTLSKRAPSATRPSLRRAANLFIIANVPGDDLPSLSVLQPEEESNQRQPYRKGAAGVAA
jgi:hypothetical protein